MALYRGAREVRLNCVKTRRGPKISLHKKDRSRYCFSERKCIAFSTSERKIVFAFLTTLKEPNSEKKELLKYSICAF